MAQLTDKPKRKSVAFADGQTVVDVDGSVTETNGSGDKTTAESHSHDASGDAAVDEVTDMFKDLAKKKKKKPKKEDDGEAGEKAAEDGDDLDLGALKKKKKKKSSKTADVDDFEKQLAEAGEGGDEKPAQDEVVDEGDPIKGGFLEPSTCRASC
jgi:translation initiation factor 2 subunit 2